MEKFTVRNRENLNLVITVEIANPQKGLAFIAHGHSGFKEQPHIQTFAQAFRDSGYTVVLYDATHSLGESGGKLEKGTTTTYYHDLEDVIAWAADKNWYQEPFVLCGHSLGGISILLYAEENPKKVKSIVPISAVISGKLSLSVKQPKVLEEWKNRGFIIEKSISKPGVLKKIKWDYVEDRNMYDTLKKTDILMMPVLLIVGEKDDVTPAKHQKILLEAIPGNNKKLIVIKGAPHTFRDQHQLEEIKAILKNWIKALD